MIPHTDPRSAALAILAARFQPDEEDDRPGGEGGAGEFELTGFQEEALRRARGVLAKRRGVLIADSVGLGKTYIALALIEEELRRGGRVGVATPAALRANWAPLLRRLTRSLGLVEPGGLGRGATVRTREVSMSTTGPLLSWTSHTRLALGTAHPTFYGGLDLLVVDEAHAFRNPRTRRYRALAELARTAKLVLITATPINNSLDDLHALIHLFASAGDFRDLGVPDLGEAFRMAVEGEGGAPTTIQPILREIMIRRTRGLVSETPAEAPNDRHSFPTRAPTNPIHYSLEEIYPGFLPEIAEALDSLILAPFQLARYGTTILSSQPTAPVELIHLGLLKRLESSLAAFRASIGRQLEFARAFVASLDRGVLRTPAHHRAHHGQGDAGGGQLALEELIFQPIPPNLDTDRLRRDTLADIHRLESIARRLAALQGAADPKLTRLRDLVDREIGSDKAIIFTEFRETARYLWRELRHRPGTALIDGEGAFLGGGLAGREEVIGLFAPNANHAPAPPPHLRVDLLIATDLLAEGFNLQDARHVVSYDLPWNPVRLMQRIGRIDRIGSTHETIHTHHFHPDHGIDRLLRLSRRLHAKLATIRETIGAADTVDLDPGDATTGSLLGPDTDERLRVAFRIAAGTGPEAPLPTTPTSTLLPAPPHIPHTTLTVARAGLRTHFIIEHHGQGATGRPPAAPFEDDIAAAEIILAALTHPTHTPPPDPTLIERAWRSARRFLGDQIAAAAAPAPLPPQAPGARAARHLLTSLAAAPTTPDPALARRIDRILPLLSRHQKAGTQARILNALQAHGTDPLTLLAALEEILPPPTGNAPTHLPEIELIAVIERRPDPPSGGPDRSARGN